jgi:hypothetical protein
MQTVEEFTTKLNRWSRIKQEENITRAALLSQTHNIKVSSKQLNAYIQNMHARTV